MQILYSTYNFAPFVPPPAHLPPAAQLAEDFMRQRHLLLGGVVLLALCRLLLLLRAQPSGNSSTRRINRPLSHQLSIADAAPTPSQRLPPSPPPPPLPSISHDEIDTAAPSDARTKPFPVVLLAHERPQRLNATLTSLRAVRGIDANQVFVLQDGSDAEVAAVVRAAGFRREALPEHRPPTADEQKSGSAIARAYQHALTRAFDSLTTDDAIIIVEDDLFFSPDLMEFFLAGYHVLRADPTLWCVSAWNDNGFHGLVSPDHPKDLLRTGWFPGLGWLLTRSLYKDELEPAWPREHWDHWMRSERVHQTSRGRECLIPAVPRTFHHGEKGTFMNRLLHTQFFAPIAYATDERIRWPVNEWPAVRARATSAAYEAALRTRIAAAKPIRDLRELLRAVYNSTNARGESGDGGGAPTSPEIALWYHQPPRSSSVTLFKELATLLGLWHELRRAQHKGVHDLWCGATTRLLLVNTVHGPEATPSPYVDLAPPEPAIWKSNGALRAAAKKAFRKLGLAEKSSVCRRLPTWPGDASDEHGRKPMRRASLLRSAGKGATLAEMAKEAAPNANGG